ncbi:hypothetical protein KI387_043785, partial [Taxus chinensis]
IMTEGSKEVFEDFWGNLEKITEGFPDHDLPQPFGLGLSITLNSPPSFSDPFRSE